MIGPGDEDQKRSPSNKQCEAYAVVKGIHSDGDHCIAHYHQDKGEAATNSLATSHLFIDRNDIGQQCQRAYQD